MADSVSIALTPGQVLVFQQFDREERAANESLLIVPKSRNAAAMAIALGPYTVEQLQNQPMQVDTDARTLTFVPNDVPPAP